MNNKDNKFNNKAFTELLNKYKAVQESDESVFFDLDDLVDVSDYYYEEGDLQKAKPISRCIETYCYPYPNGDAQR